MQPDFVAFAGKSFRQQLNEFHVGAAGGSGGYPHVGRCDADVDGAIDAGADKERSQYRHQPRVAQEHPDPVANDVLQQFDTHGLAQCLAGRCERLAWFRAAEALRKPKLHGKGRTARQFRRHGKS